jgi:hypothetical protein
MEVLVTAPVPEAAKRDPHPAPSAPPSPFQGEGIGAGVLVNNKRKNKLGCCKIVLVARMSDSEIRDYLPRIMAGGRPNRNAWLRSASFLKIQAGNSGPPS